MALAVDQMSRRPAISAPSSPPSVKRSVMTEGTAIHEASTTPGASSSSQRPFSKRKGMSATASNAPLEKLA